MTDRQTLFLYLATIAITLGLLVLQYYGYIPTASLDELDRLATIGWTLVPLFLCLAMFYGARVLKKYSELVEARTWQTRTETKAYRRRNP